MNDSYRFGTRKTRILSFRDYFPRLEILEDRLPPGDAMLGMLWGTSLATSALDAGIVDSRPTSSPTTNSVIDQTLAEVTVVEVSDTSDAPPPATADVEQQNEQTRQTQQVAASLDSPLPESHVNRPRVPQMMTPTTGQSMLAVGGAITVPIRPGSESQGRGRPNGEPMFAAPAPVFAEGTTDGYIEDVHQSMARIWGDPRYQLVNRWSGTQGTPRNLTWSFVPDGLNISSGIGEGNAPSELFSRMDALFAGQGGRPTWIARMEASFNRWTEISGITYTRITFGGNDWDDGASWGSSGSSTRGDIRVSMKPIDGGSGVLAYNYFPSNGDMVLDRSESWGGSTNMHRFLRNTVMHENGHGVGINHVCSNNQSFLMEPILSTSFDGPRHDEVRGVQRHYGDDFEDDNTPTNATDIGTLSDDVVDSNTCDIPAPLTGTNPTSTSNCSIDANSELDYFSFSVGTPSKVSLTITPLGFTYNDNIQNTNGSCQTSNSTDSLRRANLNVQLIGPDGTTVLATADTQGLGIPETISNADVPVGTFYIRVYEGDTPAQSQLYNVSVVADFKTGVSPIASDS